MTRSDPTGKAYRAALVNVRAAVPDAAHAITVHVDHLTRRVAKLEVDKAVLSGRVDDLVRFALERDRGETQFLVTTGQSEPVGVFSTETIANAAMALVAHLDEATEEELPGILASENVKLGAAAAPVFQLALHVLFSLRPSDA